MKKTLLFLLPIALVLFWPNFRTHAQSTHSDTLTWSYTQGSDPATGFFVQRATAATGPFTNLNPTALPIATLTYSDSAVTGGTTYFYQILAVDAKGNLSTPSNVVSATAVGNPNPPQTLQVTAQ